MAANVAGAAAAVAGARRRAAPHLGSAVVEQLQKLAMPGARFEVSVAGDGSPGERAGDERADDAGGDDPADKVTFLLGANAGEAALPLARVASGGELARTMLALRLALGPAATNAEDGPGTLVFDEVDAGIGGQAALAVGRALAALAADRQVLVVTHLPQVAAFADHQVAVSKAERDGRTRAEARVLGDEDRLVELSRMLSGLPASATARDHAQELLEAASRQRAGAG
jgi:DNA repair protein RecN (Recombination protein N)